MIQSNADLSESGNRQFEKLRPQESPRHFIERLASVLGEIDQDLWMVSAEISFGGKKEYPDAWNELADLAEEHFEHPLLIEIGKLDDILRDDVIKANARRTAYFYISAGGQYGRDKA